MEETRKLIIGVPLCNDLKSFQIMIESLRQSTFGVGITLLIIESESTDGGKEYCDYLATTPNIEVIHTKKEGPLKAYNLIFQIAKERKSDLLLTQSDVIFPKLYNRNWIWEMREIATGAVGAITCLNGGGVSGPDYINGMFWLGGHCTYIPYFVLNTLGGYDENFPNGYGVDIDYTYRINKLGLPIIRINYWVDHHMANTREHDRDANTEQMKQDSAKYFKNKWSLE